jgi:hypothetical protein
LGLGLFPVQQRTQTEAGTTQSHLSGPWDSYSDALIVSPRGIGDNVLADSIQHLRRTDDEIQQVTVAVFPSLTKTNLRKVATGPWAYHVVWRPVQEDRPDFAKSWRSYLILYTFNQVRSETIAQTLAHFLPIGHKLYCRPFDHSGMGNENAEHTCTVVVIDLVKSREEAASRLMKTLDDLRLVALPPPKKGQGRKRVRSE